MAASRHIDYEKDFYAWAMQTADLIRQRKFDEIDTEYVAEEIESMGRSDKRELISRLSVLIAHLLKWKFQSERRGNSWLSTIRVQRIEITRLLKQSPSLKYDINITLADAYEEAVAMAIDEASIDETKFPELCPFNLQECLDTHFLPD